MAESLWGKPHAEATSFQVAKVTKAGKKIEIVEFEEDASGDRVKWAPIAVLSREFLVNASGGGDCHLRIWWRNDNAPPKDQQRGTSPIFYLGPTEVQATRRAKSVVAEPVALPPTMPATPWEMMVAFDAMYSRRTEATIASIRADAESRVAAATAQANAQIAMQTQFFVQLEKAKAEIAVTHAKSKVDPELASTLADIKKRLEDADDEDDEDDEEEAQVPEIGQMLALFDAYNGETGEIDWRTAAQSMGPEMVDQLKPLWDVGKDVIVAKMRELAGKFATKPAPAAT